MAIRTINIDDNDVLCILKELCLDENPNPDEPYKTIGNEVYSARQFYDKCVRDPTFRQTAVQEMYNNYIERVLEKK